jgi:hypothetical protein
MTIKEKTFQLYSINKSKIEQLLINNENININIISGNSLIPLKRMKDVDTNEISIFPMDALEMSYSMKIGNGNVFLSDKYHYDKDTNTLSLYKLI